MACPTASRYLSADGERYPIEPKAIPLVYALSALRIVRPCWSCEGHADRGTQINAPQVWFYSAAAIYAQLVQKYLSKLLSNGSLTTPWEVAVCAHQPEATSTMFIVRPVASADPHLGKQQYDLGLIGTQMANGLRSAATEHLQQLVALG